MQEQQVEKNLRLRWALWYAEKMGFSIIPIVPGEKRPLIKWEPYQKQKASSDQIRRWWAKTPNANIGIVTGAISDLAVIDIDNDEGRKNIEPYLPDSFLTPIVHTPRGGLHYYCRNTPGLTNKAGLIPGTDFRGEGGYIVAPVSANGNGKAYRWADVGIGNTPLMPLPEAYIKKISIVPYIYKNSFYKEECSNSEEPNTTRNNIYYNILQEGRRDEDLFHIANCLIKGNCDPAYAQQVLKILANNSNPPFPENEITAKIESALNRAKRRERNLADEVREWCLLQEGYFLTTDLLQILQVTTKEDKRNVTVILSRLKNEGIIESYGEKRGSYRLVERKTSQMQFIETPVEEFDIKLGFGINDVCKIFPKNIIIVAGTKSSGKTALLLKWALDNQDRHPVVYLNSEMGDEEYSERLKAFGVTNSADIRLSAYNCHKNFHDHITEEKKIFIIDFMEVHDDFAQIAAYIRKVHEKLRHGICIIAVQKKVGAAFGRGAEFSMEKSRLYINLDFLPGESCTKMTLTDVKAPRYSLGYDHPRGKHKRIKIMGGSRMTALDQDWRS